MIPIDDRLTFSVFIDGLDEAGNHYDIRGNYGDRAAQLGRKS